MCFEHDAVEVANYLGEISDDLLAPTPPLGCGSVVQRLVEGLKDPVGLDEAVLGRKHEPLVASAFDESAPTQEQR